MSGKLFFVEMKNLKDGSPSAIHQFKASVKGKVKSLRDICGDSRVDLRFAKDSHVEIYILTKADGMIYQ